MKYRVEVTAAIAYKANHHGVHDTLVEEHYELEGDTLAQIKTDACNKLDAYLREKGIYVVDICVDDYLLLSADLEENDNDCDVVETDKQDGYPFGQWPKDA